MAMTTRWFGRRPHGGRRLWRLPAPRLLPAAALAFLAAVAGPRPAGAQALPACGVEARTVPCVAPPAPVPEALPGGWFRLFNGRNLSGWRVSEDAAAFRVENGTIRADGQRSHLFYDGPLMGRDFRNFELEAEIMTRPGANSAIYIHTHFMEGAWPNALPSGYEIQINHSAATRGRTASVFTFQDILESPVPDEVWYTMRILVQGRHVQVFIDGRLINDYTEPADRPSRLTGGTFALQAHEPGEVTYFREVRVRPLGD